MSVEGGRPHVLLYLWAGTLLVVFATLLVSAR